MEQDIVKYQLNLIEFDINDKEKLAKFEQWRMSIREIFRSYIAGPIFTVQNTVIYMIAPDASKATWKFNEYMQSIRDRFMGFTDKSLSCKFGGSDDKLYVKLGKKVVEG